MTCGQVAEILIRLVVERRMARRAENPPPRSPLSPFDLRELILPVIEAAEKIGVPGPVLRKTLAILIHEGPERLRLDRHMHDAPESDWEFITPETVDAWLVAFVNRAVVPMDLALYAKDLDREEAKSSKPDTRYPYTYACDLIRSFAGPDLSRADASKIRQGIAKVLGIADDHLARRLADAFKADEEAIVERGVATFIDGREP